MKYKSILLLSLLCIALICCKSKHTQLADHQIELILDSTIGQLYKQIDTTACEKEISIPIQLVHHQWNYEIQNRCRRNIACELSTNLRISDHGVPEYNISINESDEVIKSKMEAFIFNPDKLEHLATSPEKALFYFTLDEEASIRMFIAQLKRMINIYSEIQGAPKQMKLDVRRRIPPPPPPPPGESTNKE